MTIPRSLSLLIGGLGAVALVRGGGGCASQSASSVVADAGSDVIVEDARVDRDQPAEDASYPSDIEGWDVYGDYDPSCQFLVPRAREYLPPPIAWEPCRANAETVSKSCRQMLLNWQPSTTITTELTSPGTRAFRRSGGQIALMTARHQADGTIRLVADVDGPVHVAVREQDPRRCVLNGTTSDGDHYAFRVLDREAKGTVSSYGGGAIGGRLDSIRPTTLFHYHDSFTRGFIAGDPGLLEVSGGVMNLHSWKDGSLIKQVFSSSQDNGLAQNFQFFHGNTLFWASDSFAINKQKVFTDAAGAKDLLSFGNDFTKGVADLGTDGQHLVWIEGADRPEPTGVFPTVQAFVAPFTTDPTQIQKRVLRADLSGYPFGTSPFVVGCGHAARSVFLKAADGGFAGGTMIIRLSDGYAWHLPDGPGVEWGWRKPLAITCDEVFILIAEKPTPSAQPRANVARVRLDSLGPPMAP